MTDKKSLKLVHENRFSDIFEQTINDMKIVGTYKPEFSPAITRYAEMRVHYEIIMQQWYATNCKITEKYTNKSGATNNRKTTIYLAIEKLRSELIEIEDIFGLTPAGLKKIHKKSLDSKKKSLLAEALSGLQ